jgi:hypothetical protein
MNDEWEALEFVAGRKGNSEFPRRRYPQAACSDFGPMFAFVLMVSRPLAKAFFTGRARHCALFASGPSNFLDEKLLLILVFFVHGCLRHSKLLRTVNIRVLLVPRTTFEYQRRYSSTVKH